VFQAIFLYLNYMSYCATVAQLIEILGAAPQALPTATLAETATGITTDTRHLMPGAVFLALRGDNFDGHQFVDIAAEKGAIAAVVDSVQHSSRTDLPLIEVADTLQAYQAIARWWRDRFAIPVIAITGSVGKTTTKELVAAVLSRHGKVLKSQANYNNEIGVPKTLLELGDDHNYAVVEMGMRAVGEIALLTQIAHPDIAVITNVGTAHIGRLGSEAAIAQAKCELLAEMPPTGTAILNNDSPLLLKTAHQIWQGQTVTYGIEGGDIHGQMLAPDRLSVDGIVLPLPLPGRHNALNYLAAIATAKVLGLDWASLAAGLTVTLPGGRARRYDLSQDVVILDETYNAGLESMLAALRLLAETPGKRRIAVLGTMKELGERSPAFHQKVGEAAQQLHLDGLLILADTAAAEAMAEGAKPLAAECFTSYEAVVDRLTQIVQPGDRLLFKASRAVGLDQVVDQFRLRRQGTDASAVLG